MQDTLHRPLRRVYGGRRSSNPHVRRCLPIPCRCRKGEYNQCTDNFSWFTDHLIIVSIGQRQTSNPIRGLPDGHDHRAGGRTRVDRAIPRRDHQHIGHHAHRYPRQVSRDHRLHARRRARLELLQVGRHHHPLEWQRWLATGWTQGIARLLEVGACIRHVCTVKKKSCWVVLHYFILINLAVS